VFNRRDFLKKIGKFLTPHTSQSQVDKAATDRRQKQGQVKVNKAQSIPYILHVQTGHKQALVTVPKVPSVDRSPANISHPTHVTTTKVTRTRHHTLPCSLLYNNRPCSRFFFFLIDPLSPRLHNHSLVQKNINLILPSSEKERPKRVLVIISSLRMAGGLSSLLRRRGRPVSFSERNANR